MTIYFVDIDTGLILEESYDNVANLEQFERELYELYPDGWYYDKLDAEFDLLELVENDTRYN